MKYKTFKEYISERGKLVTDPYEFLNDEYEDYLNPELPPPTTQRYSLDDKKFPKPKSKGLTPYRPKEKDCNCNNNKKGLANLNGMNIKKNLKKK